MSRISLKNVKERVAAFLSSYPSLRDDDHRLIANIWYEDALQYDPDININVVKSFLKLVSEGALSNPESIRRSRQLLQEKNPEFRGDLYAMRKSNANNIKKEVIEEKHNINNQESLWE